MKCTTKFIFSQFYGLIFVTAFLKCLSFLSTTASLWKPTYNITSYTGHTTYLNCHIPNDTYHDNTISWVRLDKDGRNYIIYIGIEKILDDPRFSLLDERQSDLKLKIAYTKKSDEGFYECQLLPNVEKKIAIIYNLTVLDAQNESQLPKSARFVANDITANYVKRSHTSSSKIKHSSIFKSKCIQICSNLVLYLIISIIISMKI